MSFIKEENRTHADEVFNSLRKPVVIKENNSLVDYLVFVALLSVLLII